MGDGQRPAAGPRSWSRADVEAFVAMGVERRYRKGSTVVRQGDPTSVHLIEHGWVKVTRTTQSGHEVLLVVEGRGALTGHFEAIQGPLTPAHASVAALEPTTTVSVAADRFTDFLITHPQAWMAQTRALVDLVVRNDLRRIDLALVGAGPRLAALLVDLADRHGRETDDGLEIAIALSQDEIGGLIGASRDSVIRALGSMRARGAVVTGRRSITITDIDVVRSWAEREHEPG